MPTSSETSGPTTNHKLWQVKVRVIIAITETTAIKHHRVIKQRPVAIRCGAETLEEMCEQAHVVGIDLCQLRELLGIITVVRQLAMSNII